MRLATYISGTLSVMFVIMGVLFKIQHWPGAQKILAVGLGIFGLIFVPVYAIYRYKKTK